MMMDLTNVSEVVVTAIVGLSGVGGSALVAAMLPKASANSIAIFKIIRAVVDFIGANWLNAKNK